MFGTRRLAKRSIIGTRVSAPWQDGRFHPGVIQSTQTGPNDVDLYTVLFDDGYSAIFTENNIVGPGFQNISAIHLQKDQKVFLTYSGREFPGLVKSFDQSLGEATVTISLMDGSEMSLTRSIDDIRLLESRRSARLQDQDTDYSRLVEMHPEPKKRTVSSVIDVPGPAPKQSRRRRLSPQEDDEMDDEMRMDEDVMSEQAAAMVLTSLSCSPVSPQLPSAFTDRGEGHMSSSVNSSGVFTFKSESGTPSPPHPMAGSAPTGSIFDMHPIDEGIDPGTDEIMDNMTDREGVPTRTVFKCTWPGCSKVHLSVEAIEKHVRQKHLGPKDPGEEDFSDHEEEFYYTEEEVSIESMTQTFADMYTSSPPQVNHMEPTRSLITDHDYQKKGPKTSPQNIPRISQGSSARTAASYPIQVNMQFDLPNLSKSLSWQHPEGASSFPGTSQMRLNKPHEKLHQLHSPKTHLLSSSPKTSPAHKKARSDIKKCRKVYGMENRDLWCTQCKWKKACTRFLD